jgi:tRNA threonylcarbamoyl adenosine modification protein YeaZ
MRTIAIDTSLAGGSVAACNGLQLAVRQLGEATGHARLVASALAAATADLGWRPADAELVAVIRGPGSFTGLRVGVSAAKAIAWAGGCRLVGVSGFEAVAAETAATAGHHLPPDAAWYPSAARAAALAIPRAMAGQTDDPATLLPEYARPSYADERAGQPKS